jgi:hypothetical protein
MEKPTFNYNEYLRYVFAGGFGMLCYFFLQPNVYNSLFTKEGDFKDALFLVFAAMVIGSFLYGVHRAILYPICLRINYVILILYKKVKTRKKWWAVITGQQIMLDEDFRRWNQRDNPSSFARHLIDWSAQIHFLYCCVWAMIAARIFSFQHITPANFLKEYWWYFATALFMVALRSHYRSLLYDLAVAAKDEALKRKDY